MEESEDTILEERDELMVSPGGGNGSDISLKTAHFLKPTLNTTNFQLPPHSISSKSATLKDSTPLDVSFKGWKFPKPEWRDWVTQLRSKHQSLWRKVGIYEAIMSSICWIERNRNVVLGLAEKWCPETNTFMFPWGEATVTLEDVMLLGGYHVLGYPVLGNPFFSCPLITIEEKKTHEKLVKMLASCNDLKAWLKHFMGSGHELEHEAFLSAWLSKYVFPTHFSSSFISNHVFPIAIHLARGTPMALAPAVLCSIYRDLGLLKEKMVTLDEHMTSESLLLYAPFQLVLLWFWERFPVFSPTPKPIASGDPRAARWGRFRSEAGVESVRLAIESAGESFQWRPYALAVNWAFSNCYADEEQWIIVESDLDREFKSLVRCLRTSELVGPGCIQQYPPHRVAQQFGMDQDIPGLVARRNASPIIACSYYDRPITDAKLYVPPRICRAGVTLRYSEWWKQLAQGIRGRTLQYSSSPQNPMSPQDSTSGRIDARTSTESSSALLCHKSKFGGAAEGNNQELADLTLVDNSWTDLGIEGSVVTRPRSARNQKRSRSLALILHEDSMKQLAQGTRGRILHCSSRPQNPMSPQDSTIGRIDTPTSAESSSALLCRKSKFGGAVQGNDQELADLTLVGNGWKSLDIEGSVVTRPRSLRNRKRSRSFLILQKDNRKGDVNVVFHPESDEPKEDPKEDDLAEEADQTYATIVGENNQDVPSGFAQTTTETKKCDFVVKVDTNEQIVRDRDGEINIAGIPNHVAAAAQSPEVANTKSRGQEDNGLFERPEAETLFANGGEGMKYRVKIPGLKLEAMIAELEVKVAALKAARLNNVSLLLGENHQESPYAYVWSSGECGACICDCIETEQSGFCTKPETRKEYEPVVKLETIFEQTFRDCQEQITSGSSSCDSTALAQGLPPVANAVSATNELLEKQRAETFCANGGESMFCIGQI